jgi:hypothetical protein
MIAHFRKIPTWLAVLPGLLAGWMIARSATVELSSDSERQPRPLNSRTAGELADPASASHSTAGPAQIRLEPAKLRLLRNSHIGMKLDLTSFAPGRQLDPLFEILRGVLDLTTREEAALRDTFTRSADSLRTYERDQISGFSTADGRISFQLPPAGAFYHELARSITHAQTAILGDERSAIFSAITHTDAFCDIPEKFGGAVEFRANPEDRSIRMLIDHEQRQITWISQSTTAGHEGTFGRFDHLIDPGSKRRFLEATLRGE